MTQKDKFLRALQSARPGLALDLPFAFGLALNLSEQTIPQQIEAGAHELVLCVSTREMRHTIIKRKPTGKEAVNQTKWGNYRADRRGSTQRRRAAA